MKHKVNGLNDKHANTVMEVGRYHETQRLNHPNEVLIVTQLSRLSNILFFIIILQL